jgi:hypothetical protein
MKLRLILYFFLLVLRPAQEYFTYNGGITITREGLQNFGLCLALRAFEQGGIFYDCATPAVTQGLGSSGPN